MPYRILAECVVILHLAFVGFAVLGGLLVVRWRRLLWPHIASVLWAVWIEYSGGICPLTPLENHLRQMGGAAGYPGSFVEHHILPLLYPARLTRTLQFVLGTGVLIANLGIYGYLFRIRDRQRNRL